MSLAHATIRKIAGRAYMFAFQSNLQRLREIAHAVHLAKNKDNQDGKPARRLANDLEQVSNVEVALDEEELIKTVHNF